VLTKRRMLGTLAALAVAIPAGITAVSTYTAQAATVPATIPLTFTNNTGRTEPVYLYVLGTNLTTGKLGYANVSGAFTAWAGGANPPVAAPDVSIAGPATGASVTIQIPKLSGRIYFSFGTKLKFFLTPDGLVQPAVQNPSDPNRDTLFDWSEFTLNDSGLWLNSSQVDMFAIPHIVGVTGTDGTSSSTGKPVDGGRTKVFDSLTSLGNNWQNLVYTRSDGLRVRALAPGKGIDAGVFSTTQLDAYITKAWDTYTTKTLTVVPFTDQPNTKYFGHTSGSAMVFTNSSGATVATIQKPSTANVFGCDGALQAPNDNVVGPIARTLCAALNRTTLAEVSVQPSTDASQFYTATPTNQYAKLIHANMADGKAYAFAFDDVGNFESLVNNGSPQKASITLPAF
jgi:Beta-1,3-glucanase